MGIKHKVCKKTETLLVHLENGTQILSPDKN